MRISGSLVAVAGLLTLVLPALPAVGQQGEGYEIPATALSAYTPPACVAGVPFTDVTCTTPYDAWIEQFARDGVTGGCGGGNYCPSTAVTRDQMAVFIERAMRGTANWPPHVAFAWAVKNSSGAPDAAASGAALLAALASIPTSGNDAPSAGNPWLLKIGPGIFDLGGGVLQMVDYVAVEGSGRNTSILESTAFGSPNGTVRGANAELRDLGIQNTGGTGYASALLIPAGVTQTVRRLSLAASGGTVANYGAYVSGGAAATLQDCTLSLTTTSGSAPAYGVYADSSASLALDRVDISMTSNSSSSPGAGVFVVGSVTGRLVSVTPTLVSGSTALIHGIVVTGTLDLSDSTIAGGCAATGGWVYAIWTTGTTAVADVTASALPYLGASCNGVALYLNGGGGSVRTSSFEGFNWGMLTAGAATAQSVNVDGTRVQGDIIGGLSNGANYTTAVSNSWMDGTANVGTLTCRGVADAAGFYATTCP